jgi:high-affinity Fe2+/Pb2+ permease
MDVAKTITGIIIIVLAALLLADGVIQSSPSLDWEPFFSLTNFKLIVGIIALVLGGSYMLESRK